MPIPFNVDEATGVLWREVSNVQVQNLPHSERQFAVLTAEQIDEVRALHKAGMPHSEIAKKYRTSIGAIKAACRRKTKSSEGTNT
jgi:hypothetical protein